ncbi:alpha/beta hydrolase [Aquabacterium sp. J223]|uniref:alpha/beta hydrolase n=1 Tax=Aquabacterium sp. J223 TaxID=2898431 RepID=UPI0021AD7090|nr:alpha/beta hydrolase [Aquabacterium sp. J223]UUX94743.1 alpha/beta hydrolase [Aquabacterium sp. J223]
MPFQRFLPGRRAAFLFGGLSALGLTGCSATGALNALVPRDSYRGESGIAYGPHPRQRLDVYRPLPDSAAAARRPPLVVFFYGGNWTRGERADYRFVGEALAAHGVVSVLPDYRLSPEVGWRDILADCAAATAWARREAATFGADPARLILMGHSAGGYNAAMLALDGRWLGAQQLSPRQLAGWIGLAGPYDFLPIGDPETRVAFSWPDTPRDSQPIHHVAAGAPPALLLAAANDRLVYPERNTLPLAARLRAAGVPVRAEVLERVNHATLVGAIAAPLRWLAPVLPPVLDFIEAPGAAKAPTMV